MIKLKFMNLSRDNLLKLTLFSAIFILTIQKISDFDIFWHLPAGEYIYKFGFLKQDIFSYTAQNREWITHEWLSQVIFYLVYKLSGFVGIIFLKSFLILLTFYIVHRHSLKYANFNVLTVLIIFFSAYISSMFFTERPHLFSFLFIVILLYVLHIEKLFLLPLLFLLWCNLHSGFILGFVILFIHIIFDKNKKQLFFWLILSVLSSIINPSGLNILIYPFYTIFNPHHIELILEWQSPNFHLWQMMLVELFIFTGIISFIVNKNNIIWKNIFLFLFLTHLALYNVRNIPFLAIIVAPIILKNLSLAEKLYIGQSCKPPSKFVNLIFFIFVLFAVISTVFYRLGDKDHINTREFPGYAVKFIKENKLKGNIFNEYDWGGYLIFTLYPEHRVFIDGRQDLYSPEITEEYLKIMNFENNYNEILDKYKIKFLLLRKNSPLVKFLELTGKKKIYTDDISVIFER